MIHPSTKTFQIKNKKYHAYYKNKVRAGGMSLSQRDVWSNREKCRRHVCLWFFTAAVQNDIPYQFFSPSLTLLA